MDKKDRLISLLEKMVRECPCSKSGEFHPSLGSETPECYWCALRYKKIDALTTGKLTVEEIESIEVRE